MITIATLIFVAFFCLFIGFFGGQFIWVIYFALKTQGTAMLINFRNLDHKLTISVDKIKWTMGMGGKDKRTINPTGRKGVNEVIVRKGLGRFPVEIVEGNYIMSQTERNYPCILNNVNALSLGIKRLLDHELKRNYELESDIGIIMEQLMKLKKGQENITWDTIDKFIQRYGSVWSYYQKKKGGE